MATYERLSTSDPDAEDLRKSVSNSDTGSSDIEVNDVKDNNNEDKSSSEHQLLLPTDNELHKAVSKRKAQLLKVTMAAIVCLLQTVALPLFYGEVENFWGEESEGFLMAAKYTLYGCFMLSCLLAPMLIAMFGIKVILVSGSLSVCLFVSANFVPLQYSAIPASVLSGLTMGPFFVAQGVFIMNCAYRYCSTLTSCDKDAIVNITNGLFYTIVLAAPVLLSAMKLLFLETTGLLPNDNPTSPNNSQGCEPHSCLLYSGYKNELFIIPDIYNYQFSFHRIQALHGSHLVIAFAGLIMSALVFNSNHPVIAHLRKSKCTAPPEQFKWSPTSKTTSPCKVALKEHFRLSASKCCVVFTTLKDTNIILVLPLFLYLGLQQGLMYNVFIKDVVGCRLDRQRVYFMRMIAGTSSVLMSLPVAIMARYTGRFRISLPAVAAQASLALTMLLWKPGLDQWGVLYAVAALWGCADAVWHVLTSSLVGRIFRAHKDAAYSQLRLCQVFGLLIIDLLRSFFCTTVVISVFLAIFCLSFISFVAFEIWLRLQLKSNLSNDGSHEVSLTIDRNATWVPTLDPHVPRQRESLSAIGRAR